MAADRRRAVAGAKGWVRPRQQAEEATSDYDKYTRLALQNAASVSGLLLTTEVMIAEAPKDDDHAHGGAPGGMGGMGGMDM